MQLPLTQQQESRIWKCYVIIELQDKVDELENSCHRNNVCFDGIPEQVGGDASWKATEYQQRELGPLKLQYLSHFQYYT